MTSDAQWVEARRRLIEIGFPLEPSGGVTQRLAQAVENFQQGWSFGWLKPDRDPGTNTLSAMQSCLSQGGRCSPHFSYREFASQGNGQILMRNELVLGLEHARQQMGGAPIKILSGYRDPRHNSKVGGSPTSQHMTGAAADLELSTIDVVKSWGVFTGIGAVSGTGKVVHVDVRDGDPKHPTLWMYLPEGGIGDAPQSWRRFPVVGNGLAALASWEAPTPVESPTGQPAPALGVSVTSSDAIPPIADAGAALAFVEKKGIRNPDTPEHVDRIMRACVGAQLSEPQTAYVLATALHESRMGEWMEEHSSGDAYEGRIELGNNRSGDGRRFKGRGYVQLTGRFNYRVWTQRLQELGHDVDLVAKPSDATKPGIAAVILVRGMAAGSFTGRGLDWYINDTTTDFVEARRVINGKNKAAQIAGYANHFLDALRE